MPSRKLTKRGILQVTHLSDHDIHKARNLSTPTPPPPSAYFQRHHKARHSFDSATGDTWLPPLQLGAPVFSSPGPLQPLTATHSPLLLDFDWDPHYCLHNPAQTRQTKPKFTIGADDLADDDPPTAPRHRPPFTRRHAAVSLTDNGGINTKYSLTMAMMDDSISDESLIKLLEDAVIFNSPPISPSASHVEPTPASTSTSPPFNLGLSPSTIRLITHDLSTSPPSSSSIPSFNSSNHQTTFNLPLTSSNGDPHSRPLPPLPSPTREYPASSHVAGIHIPRHHDHHHFHPYHSSTPHHTHRIYPHHPTFRRALLTVRELIRTEKTYLDSLRLLLDYPSPTHSSKPSPGLPFLDSQNLYHDDVAGGGEDDLSSNSHSPSRSTSFAHSSYVQHHPFPKHAQTTKPHPKSTTDMGDVDASKYTPPPLMRAYVVELAKVSESLVMRMEKDLCVRGVAGAFVDLCDLVGEVGGEGKATTATVGSAEWEASLAYPHASLENVYVAWSGVVGSWFADTQGDGAREEEEARLRRKKEKGGDGRRRLSKTRRLSMLPYHPGSSQCYTIAPDCSFTLNRHVAVYPILLITPSVVYEITCAQWVSASTSTSTSTSISISNTSQTRPQSVWITYPWYAKQELWLFLLVFDLYLIYFFFLILRFCINISNLLRLINAIIKSNFLSHHRYTIWSEKGRRRGDDDVCIRRWTAPTSPSHTFARTAGEGEWRAEGRGRAAGAATDVAAAVDDDDG
ncbi:hypothetical protein ONZ45_g17305 [Pleurotus djamor]|nr:hypothetical protein ONZ45_g17305 [Pleurotus djamor]